MKRCVQHTEAACEWLSLYKHTVQTECSLLGWAEILEGLRSSICEYSNHRMYCRAPFKWTQMPSARQSSPPRASQGGSVLTAEHSCFSLCPQTHCHIAVLLRAAGRATAGSRRSPLLCLCLCSSPCQEVLLWFLEKSERETSLWVLEGCVGLTSSVHRLHPQCCFRVGSEGGAAIAVKEPIR